MIQARIDPDSDLIQLSFRYNLDYVQRIKTIPHRRYDPETRTWLIPKPQWRRFIRIFRDVPVQIPWDQTDDFSILEKPDMIPSISEIEGFRGELYPFQQKGVGFLITRKRCLLADELGLGKTVQSIAASLELQNRGLARRVLVFCPKTLIRQWIKEIRKFTDEEAIAIAGTRQQRRAAYSICRNRNIFFAITNYATVLREAEDLAQLSPDITILDEVTRIKNFRAKTTRLIKEYFRTPYRWALSGTPLENRLEELYSIMEWVDSTILEHWKIFSSKYIITRERTVYVRGGERRRFREVVGYRNLAELRDHLRGWILRRRKRDVLPDLPDVTVNTHYVELEDEERSAYSIISKYVWDLYRERGRSSAVLARLVFMRECCDHTHLVKDVLKDLGFEPPSIDESSKLRELLLILDDLVQSDYERKVVVYSEWVSMLNLIADSAPHYGVEMLHGKMSAREREDVINTFTEDPECRVLLCSDVAEEGLNLQVADTVINYELHWNPARLQQRVGRLHRIGQKNTVTCINLVAEDTIEERVLKVLGEKTGLFRKVIEGDFSSPAYENTIWQILDEEFGRRRSAWKS